MNLKEKIDQLLKDLENEKKEDLEIALDSNYQNIVLPKFEELERSYEEARNNILLQAENQKFQENERHENAIRIIENSITQNLDSIQKALNEKKAAIQEESAKNLTNKINLKYLSNEAKLNELLNNIVE